MSLSRCKNSIQHGMYICMANFGNAICHSLLLATIIHNPSTCKIYHSSLETLKSYCSISSKSMILSPQSPQVHVQTWLLRCNSLTYSCSTTFVSILRLLINETIYLFQKHSTFNGGTAVDSLLRTALFIKRGHGRLSSLFHHSSKIQTRVYCHSID